MAVTIRFNCAACSVDVFLEPSAFTICTGGDGSTPWMVWRCPSCDDVRTEGLDVWPQDIRKDLLASVSRRLRVTPRPPAGVLRLDSIIDVDASWVALSALARSGLYER